MAKQFNGKMSGSAGNFNFYIVKGEQRVRLKAHHNKSKRTIRRRRTAAQALQLARFQFASSFVKWWKDLFNVSFETVGPQIGKCQAIRYMLRSAVYGEVDDLKIDFSKLMVARGSALPPAGVQVSCTSPGKIRFTWEDNSANNRRAATDEAVLVAFCENYDEDCYFTLNGGERRTMGGELNVADKSGETYHTWISFRRKDGTCADSLYCGVVTSV